MQNNLKKRYFIVGEEWLYYKIYCGSRISDVILKDILFPIADALIADKVIEKWFYIKYGDPKPHLRFRVLLNDIKDIGIVMEKLSPPLSKLVNEELISKIQLETYQREIERYGNNTIELSEELFFHDSNLIINLLKEIIVDDENLRWQVAIVLVNNLLTNFHYNMENKLRFMELLRNGFASEIVMDKFLTKQLDTKYRNYRTEIDALLQGKSELNFELNVIINDFNLKIFNIAKKILELDQNGELELNVDSLIASYIHMTMVRILKSKNRLHEVIIYDFLLKYYKMCNARSIAV